MKTMPEDPMLEEPMTGQGPHDAQMHPIAPKLHRNFLSQ
jgi:hypothetical protein